MSKKTQHVVPSSNGGWNIQKGGASKATQHFDTKQPAIDRAREIAQNQGAELYVHGKNGRIQGKDSHGNDPFPPKG